LKDSTIILRPATVSDADLLLEWRNDPETRNASHNTGEVLRNDHISWLTKTLNDRSRQLFVAEENGVPVGTVRADSFDEACELSWMVAPNARGRGVAKRMVALLACQLSASIIRAKVRAGNTASARVAEYAGMQFEGEADGVLHYRRAALK
jgi:RimJ/RimL family protein N-acetyltransferase